MIYMGMGKQQRLYIARHKGKIAFAVFALCIRALPHTTVNKYAAAVECYHVTGTGYRLCRTAESKLHSFAASV